jgi:large subunit ribosomal protein L19
MIARKHGDEAGGTMTVRKVIDGVGVERIFPFYSPNIAKIEVVRKSKTRRAKLYNIRTKAAKEIRRKMKNIINAKEVVVETTEEAK